MSDAPRHVELLLDENLSPWAAGQLRAGGLDVAHVNERGLTGDTDAQVLDRAYQEDRVLVTSNVEDFEKLCRSRELHAGVVLIKAGDLTRAEQLAVVKKAVRILRRRRDEVRRDFRARGAPGCAGDC